MVWAGRVNEQQTRLGRGKNSPAVNDTHRASCKVSRILLSCQCCPLTCFALSYPLTKDYWGHYAHLPLTPDSSQSQSNPWLLLIQPQKRQTTKNWPRFPGPSLDSASTSPGLRKDPRLSHYMGSINQTLQVYTFVSGCLWLIRLSHHHYSKKSSAVHQCLWHTTPNRCKPMWRCQML